MNKIRRFSVSRLFKNNKFILVISLIISIAVWITVSFSSTNEVTATVSNIPIKITLSEDAVNSDLHIFTGTDQTRSVTITGNRLAVGSVTADDIIITAPNAGTILHPDSYNLSLTAKKRNSSDQFDIVSISDPQITVYVDQLQEKEVEVKNKLKTDFSDDKYYSSVNISPKKVTVKGPKSEVENVSYAAVTDKVEGIPTKAETMDCSLTFFDAKSVEVNSNLISCDDDTVKVSVVALTRKEVPIKLNISDFPQGLDIDDYSEYDGMSNTTIQIGATDDILKDIEYISTEEIDLSNYKNEKYDAQEFSLDLPSGVTNISGIKSVNVAFDFSDFSTKSITIFRDKFEVTGGEYNSIETAQLSVTVVGPESSLRYITADDLECVIDLSSYKGSTGNEGTIMSVPAKVTVKNNKSGWAYGSYEIYIDIK